MRLIQNVNLEAVASGAIPGGLTQFANFIYTPVGGRVNFDYVYRIAGANLCARITNAARLRHRILRRTAIQGHSQNTRDSGLPNSAMSAKNVAVRRASLLDRIFQRAGDVLLSDHLGESLRTIFAGEDLIAHEKAVTRLYVIGYQRLPPGFRSTRVV